MASSKSMDLTTGSVFKKLLLFTFPILMSSLLQQFYHSADVIVVGRFAADTQASLAAVGSTTNITSLFINLFIGMSVGTNVTMAHAFGEKDKAKARRILASSISIGFIAGSVIAMIGFIFTPYLLALMGTPEDVMPEATVYMRIIFLGQPANLVYNFCSAIFRAAGNAKRSLRILSFTGLMNVLMNIVFVTVFHLDAAGVALATVLANVMSAAIALYIIFYPTGEYRMTLRELRVHKEETLAIVRIGLPAGVNSMLFNISSVIVATAANALGKTVVASVSAANSLTHVVHAFGGAFGSAAVSFAGQNYGAGKLRRVDEVTVKALLMGESLLLVANVAMTLFPGFFLGLFTDDPEVIELATVKLVLTGWGYMLYNLGEISGGVNRAFGKSLSQTIINIGCICLLRVVWVLGVFPFMEQNILNLYTCIPISWGASGVAMMINLYFSRKRVWKKLAAEGKLCPEDAEYYNRRLAKKAAG